MRFDPLRLLPGIIIIGREHMAALHTAGEVVMAVEVPVAAAPSEPGTTAGATGHTAGDGDHAAPSMLPNGAFGTLAGLSVLAIVRIPGWVAIGIKELIDRLIRCPTGTTNHVS